MNTARTTRYLAIGLAILATLAVVQLFRSISTGQTLNRASDDAISASEISQEIVAARAGTSLPSEAGVQGSFRINEAIEQAVAQSGAGTSVFERAYPQPERVDTDRPFVTQGTVVSLTGVTLAQAQSILLEVGELAPSEIALKVTSMRITAPRQTEADRGPELWSVEAVLTQTQYRPTATSP